MDCKVKSLGLRGVRAEAKGLRVQGELRGFGLMDVLAFHIKVHGSCALRHKWLS